MGFKLRNNAKTWFKHIRDARDNNFKIEFDSYYFCLITGMIFESKLEVESSNTTEFIDYFPDKYKDRAKLIIGMFLSKELSRLGVSFEEKKQVHTVISKYIEPGSYNFLTDEGINELNKYANGGFEILAEKIDKPYYLEDFLIAFYHLIERK